MSHRVPEDHPPGTPQALIAQGRREVTYGIAAAFLGLILIAIGCLIEHVVLVTWLGLLILLLCVVFQFLARCRMSTVLFSHNVPADHPNG